MKNLKKALCLVLTVAMLMSMMVFATGAADFTDSDEIVNTEAVDTAVALNIINGKDDGSYFDPTGIVTRAEMAKMIAVALNGGKAPNVGTATSFTDTVGNWAAGYIEYCYNLGIVSGRGEGIFDPSATVTATEAAKMLLVAIGYDSALEGFTGSTWAINVNTKANSKELYEDLSIDVSAGLTRDNAAQMVYNALSAVLVEYDYKLVTGSDGNLSTIGVAQDVDNDETLLEKKFNLVTAYGYMESVAYDEDEGEYTYSVDSANTSFGTSYTGNDGVDANFDSEADYSALYGMLVKVLYKNNTAKTVYGIYAEDSKVVVSTIGGKLPGVATSATTAKISGTTYKLGAAADSVPVFAYNAATATDDLYAIDASATYNTYAINLIDNDGDGKIDVGVYVPFTVGKVTFVGTDTVTIGNKSYDRDDIELYDGVAKSDYAIIVDADNTAKGITTFTEATVVSGEIESISQVSSSDTTNKVVVDGTTYTNAYGVSTSYDLGSSYDLVVVNGYVYNATKVSTAASASNVALVTGKDDIEFNAYAEVVSIQLLFADGTKKVIEVSEVNGNAVKEDADEDGADADEVGLPGTLYTYEIDDDGYYELTSIDATDFDKATVGTDDVTVSDGKTSNGYRFADDAVVFYSTATTFKVTTGATVNGWASITTANTGNTDAYYANSSNGFNYVELAYLNLGATPSADGDTSYGWVTAAPTLVKDGTNYRVKMTIFNGTTTETYLAKSVYGLEGTVGTLETVGANTSSSDILRTTSAANKGRLVSYKDVGDGTITTVQNVGTVNAVTGYEDGGDEVQFQDAEAVSGSTLLTIEDDTVILYVDTANNAGVTGGAISVADESAVSSYSIRNAYVLGNTDDEILVLVIDTTNNLAANDDDALISALENDAGTDVFAAVNNTDLEIDASDAGTITIANGQFSDADALLTGGVAYYVDAAGATLAAGDTITVVAADGTFVIYEVVA